MTRSWLVSQFADEETEAINTGSSHSMSTRSAYSRIAVSCKLCMQLSADKLWREADRSRDVIH